jgi:hypothetical protein
VELEAWLSGIGVDGPGVGLTGGWLAVSAVRLLDSEASFLEAADFFFLVMIVILRGNRRKEERVQVKFDRINNGSQHKECLSPCFQGTNMYSSPFRCQIFMII